MGKERESPDQQRYCGSKDCLTADFVQVSSSGEHRLRDKRQACVGDSATLPTMSRGVGSPWELGGGYLDRFTKLAECCLLCLSFWASPILQAVSSHEETGDVLLSTNLCTRSHKDLKKKKKAHSGANGSVLL